MAAQFLGNNAGEWCAVTERTPQDTTSPLTVSDGMGGFKSQFPTVSETDPTDEAHFRIYPCRRTVPHTLLRNTQFETDTVMESVISTDLLLPPDAVVFASSYILMTTEEGEPILDPANNEIRYKVTRIEVESQTGVRHILCTQVIT
jgi:hypothetical protein